MFADAEAAQMGGPSPSMLRAVHRVESCIDARQWTNVDILAVRVLCYQVLVANYRAIKGQTCGGMPVREPSACNLLANLVVVVALRSGLPHAVLSEHLTLVALLPGELEA